MARTKNKTPPYLGENLSQIKKLGLQNNINDLEIDGFTVIPPKKIASTQFLNKMEKKENIKPNHKPTANFYFITY